MAQTAEKVIFAEEAATVHIIDGDVEEMSDGTKYEPHFSRVLQPGETLMLNEVPSYLREAVEKGEAPGLTLLTPVQAKRLVNKAEKIKANYKDVVEVLEED